VKAEDNAKQKAIFVLIVKAPPVLSILSYLKIVKRGILASLFLSKTQKNNRLFDKSTEKL
jgi:hypothetical protein